MENKRKVLGSLLIISLGFAFYHLFEVVHAQFIGERVYGLKFGILFSMLGASTILLHSFVKQFVGVPVSNFVSKVLPSILVMVVSVGISSLLFSFEDGIDDWNNFIYQFLSFFMGIGIIWLLVVFMKYARGKKLSSNLQ